MKDVFVVAEASGGGAGTRRLPLMGAGFDTAPRGLKGLSCGKFRDLPCGWKSEGSAWIPWCCGHCDRRGPLQAAALLSVSEHVLLVFAGDGLGEVDVSYLLARFSGLALAGICGLRNRTGVLPGENSP